MLNSQRNVGQRVPQKKETSKQDQIKKNEDKRCGEIDVYTQ